MKIQSPLAIAAGGFLGAAAIRAWMSTLDFRVAYYDPTVDPVHPESSGHKIFLFWHEYILFPIYLRGHCNVAMLLSQHRDAEILSRVAHHLGFACVRGSTYRGAATALRELKATSRHAHLTMTPDGPRGPRRTLAQGPIYLASRLRLPLVAIGFGYDRPWRMPTWDNFALPRPGSRARAVMSPALSIPPGLERDGLEHYRQSVERMLNRMTLEAEAWAEAGTPKVADRPFRCEHPRATKRLKRGRSRPRALSPRT
jgi:lysophospholipid acyltransferase (LPLAT)-like uncharacterized protein